MKEGDIYESERYGDMLVLGVNSRTNVWIRFLTTGYERSAGAKDIKKGQVKDLMHPTIYSTGYLGGRKFSKTSNKKAYTVWTDMIRRCYSSAFQKRNASYVGCEVTAEWLNFQTFCTWFEEHYSEGLHIDKDIKGSGKLYSPDSCMFVTQTDNSSHSNNVYTLLSPDNEVHSFSNISEFSRQHLLDNSNVSKVLRGVSVSHKGWRLPNAVL